MSEEILRMKNANDQSMQSENQTGNDEQAENIMIIGDGEEQSDIDSERLNKLIGKPEEVTFKCTAIVQSQRKGIKRKYIIPKSENEGTWFEIQKKMLGKKEGDVFSLREIDTQYLI